MKNSNLAERLEDYEAELDNLQLRGAPWTRQAPGAGEAGNEPASRGRRKPRPTIEIRDQGLRPFRIR